MSKILYIGFKGQNNSSAALVKSLPGQSVLLTNSFPGLKNDIDGLSAEYDGVCLFGVDKSLTDSFRRDGIREILTRNMQDGVLRLPKDYGMFVAKGPKRSK